MVPLPNALYDAMEELAKRNHRPVSWQIRMILEAAAKAEGIDPDNFLEERIRGERDLTLSVCLFRMPLSG
jgi:hypothetical protein